jgi:orotidine-5'-phosphate decarboxylase
MDKKTLFSLIKKKDSFLCVGLDSDYHKIPEHLRRKAADPIFEFNKQIIDATHHYAIAYKPNLAFYESMGTKGWESLVKTMEYLMPLREDLFLIADAKRGDIGNTSRHYAQAFFGGNDGALDFDAITVAPYMGSDSVTPFLEFKNKWVILLGLTSNPGADDFQKLLILPDNKPLYKHVIETSKTWADENQMMYVVGATQNDYLKEIRKLLPQHFLLIPGIGAQGGSLSQVAKAGMNSQCGLIVNSSRDILFASDRKDFAIAAGQKARHIQQQMAGLLHQYL